MKLEEQKNLQIYSYLLKLSLPGISLHLDTSQAQDTEERSRKALIEFSSQQ